MGGEGSGPNAQMILLCAGSAFAPLLRQRVQIGAPGRGLKLLVDLHRSVPGQDARGQRRLSTRAAPVVTVVTSTHPAAIRRYDSHCSAPTGSNACFWPKSTTGRSRSMV